MDFSTYMVHARCRNICTLVSHGPHNFIFYFFLKTSHKVKVVILNSVFFFFFLNKKIKDLPQPSVLTFNLCFSFHLLSFNTYVNHNTFTSFPQTQKLQKFVSKRSYRSLQLNISQRSLQLLTFQPLKNLSPAALTVSHSLLFPHRQNSPQQSVF